MGTASGRRSVPARLLSNSILPTQKVEILNNLRPAQLSAELLSMC